jgi:hypothetical protein
MQVNRIENLCDYLEANKAALDKLPVSMPDDPGSLGLDIPLWVGLGTVGLWGALDAFAERAGLKAQCSICDRNCIVEAYKSKFQASHKRSFEELEDLRHLYAHNYAGNADDEYLKRKRHVLQKGVRERLSCGAIFDGWRLCRENDILQPDLTSSDPQYTVNAPRLPPQYALNLSDLRKYSGIVRSVLERF